LCLWTCPLLLVAALAGVTVGASASAVVHKASVKSRIAGLLMGGEFEVPIGIAGQVRDRNFKFKAATQIKKLLELL
jgi:hypothetical protein